MVGTKQIGFDVPSADQPTSTIEILPYAVRFGSASYQLTNISVVRLRHERKFNPVAVLLGVLGAVVVAVVFSPELPRDTRWFLGVAGTCLIIGAIACQSFWPKHQFTFSIRANSGDREVFVTNDREQALRLKQQVEDAFGMVFAERRERAATQIG